MRIAIVAAICFVMSACSSPQVTNEDLFAAVPADFALDVTISAPLAPGVELPPSQRLANLRPSRYILFPDGSLCYGPDPESRRGVHWVPPITRVLTRQQIAELWSMAQQLGFADPRNGDDVVNFRLLNIQRGERAHLIGFHGMNTYWNFVRRAPMEDPADPAVAEFIQYLAALAWADEIDSDAKFLPKRYDFGPDPYSRYRNQESN